MRFILPLILSLVISSATIAATDSLVVKGRILNLNGRLYRQAPTITFSRNNLFQPQSELSKQVALEADGSFRVSLPLLYKLEEIYLDYSGKAFTTFLGSPGTVEITFNGDSLNTKGKLFYFAGENALANNQFIEYLANENVLFKNNAPLGAKFYSNFWERDAVSALSAATLRSELRVSAFTATTNKRVPNPTLELWVKSLATDEFLQNMFEYVLSNRVPMGTLLDSMGRLASQPLTAQKVTLASRFGTYADRKIEELNFQNPAKNRSLPARLMGTLIANNVPTLSADEREKINQISEMGISARTDLDFLSKMYSKNEQVLNLLFDFERAARPLNEEFKFNGIAVDFLKARYLAKNFYKYTPKQILILNAHIQSRIAIPQFKASLNELVNLEMRDSADIRKLVEYKDIVTAPKEILPGYWFSASNDDGVNWLNGVLNKYIGKTIYLVKWSMDDEKSRELLEFMPSLRRQLPDNVEIVYLHSTFSDETNASKDLWKQYILHHHLQGVHLMLNGSQTMDLLFKLNPMDAATFSIIKPNGKFFAKVAPTPEETAKVAEAILQAGK
jgi:hypothetical protein